MREIPTPLQGLTEPDVAQSQQDIPEGLDADEGLLLERRAPRGAGIVTALVLVLLAWFVAEVLLLLGGKR